MNEGPAHDRDDPVELVLVCGPWSSGTTAVAGILAALGLDGLPPFHLTRDERTPNSYESRAFRRVVREVAWEGGVSLRVSLDEVVERLTAFREGVLRQDHGPYSGQTLFLKYPLSALIIPQICRVFRTRLIYTLRPLRQIEATRARRGWLEHTGAQGARVLYSAMFRALLEQSIPMPLLLPFADLLREPTKHAHAIARLAGLAVDADRVEEAARFVRRA